MTKTMKEFLEAIKNNKELQAKFRDIPDKEGIVAAAKEAGYEITIEEIETMTQDKKGEIKDDDLEAVAGGICFFLSMCPLTSPDIDPNCRWH